MRIAFLPLDDRPVTRGAFLRLAAIAGVEVATPPRALLGGRRVPADVEALWAWIDTGGAEADLLIASAELLIYGGLVPSRIGDESLDRCLALAGKFAGLRRRAPDRRLWLSASNLRLPSAPDASEEPEYWGEYGPQIFAYRYPRDRAGSRHPGGVRLPRESRRDSPVRRAEPRPDGHFAHRDDRVPPRGGRRGRDAVRPQLPRRPGGGPRAGAV